MGYLQNRVVAVIGGSSGMGRVTALALAREGATVVVGARRQQLCEQVASEIRAAGGQSEAIALDATDADSVAEFFRVLHERHGRLDGAFNNVGRTLGSSPITETTLERFEQTLAFNLRSTFLCLQQEVRLMRDQGHGAIVNNSSIGGSRGFAGLQDYCAAKWGVVGLFGGAINYVMNRPGESLAGDAKVTFGNEGRLDYEFVLGGPVVDGVLGLRAYYGHSEFDGTWRNEYPGLTGDLALMGNRDNATYSLLATITPSEAVDIELSYMRVDREVGNRAGWNISTGDAQNSGNCGPTVAPSTRLRYVCGTLPLLPQAFQTAASTRPVGANSINVPTPGFVNETDFYRADVDFKVSDAVSVTYQYGKVKSAGQEISNPASNALNPSFGLNFSALAVGQTQLGFFNSVQKEGSTNNFDSHELRLDYAPSGSPLKATVGAYRSKFNDVYRFYLGSLPKGQFLPNDPTSGFLDMTGFAFGLTDKTNIGKTTAYFAAVSYDFTDKLTAGAELRYSKEDKSVIDTRARVTLGDSFSDVIPRFTVDYNLAEGRMLYASVGKGLKTGGFNGVTAGSLTIPLGEQAFGPETNVSIEVGSKNTLMDGRMLLNVAVYNVDWTDMQIQALPSNAPANITNIPVIYRNIGDARSRGIEIESLFQATDNLSLNFGASFSDPKYKDGTTSFRFAGRCDGVVCPLDTAIGGKTLPRTPKTQLIGGVEWNSTIGDGIAVFARGDVTYQSQMQVEEMNIAQIQARTLVNARVGFAKNNWSADIWGKNILDKKYISNSFFIISGTGYSVAMGERQTYGMTLRYKF
ncbi:MAG: TonB-dependent receptor [Gammaproteobacteria bacterium]|nr:TonB-dependent receptor [Gammaproteobacteria bacterium]